MDITGRISGGILQPTRYFFKNKFGTFKKISYLYRLIYQLYQKKREISLKVQQILNNTKNTYPHNVNNFYLVDK